MSTGKGTALSALISSVGVNLSTPEVILLDVRDGAGGTGSAGGVSGNGASISSSLGASSSALSLVFFVSEIVVSAIIASSLVCAAPGVPQLNSKMNHESTIACMPEFDRLMSELTFIWFHRLEVSGDSKSDIVSAIVAIIPEGPAQFAESPMQKT